MILWMDELMWLLSSQQSWCCPQVSMSKSPDDFQVEPCRGNLLVLSLRSVSGTSVSDWETFRRYALCSQTLQANLMPFWFTRSFVHIPSVLYSTPWNNAVSPEPIPHGFNKRSIMSIDQPKKVRDITCSFHPSHWLPHDFGIAPSRRVCYCDYTYRRGLC